MPATVEPTPPALPTVTRIAARIPSIADLECDRTDGDGVEDAALRIDVGGGDESQDGERSDDVHEGDERAGAEDGAGQGAARIADLFAHGGDQFEAGEGEGDLRPEVDRVPVPCGQHVGDGEVGGGAMAESRRVPAMHDQHDERHVGADAAGVLQPLADVEADDVEDHGDQEQGRARR